MIFLLLISNLMKTPGMEKIGTLSKAGCLEENRPTFNSSAIPYTLIPPP